MDIANAKKKISKAIGGEETAVDLFSENEKERASQIASAVKGLTIREAADLLSRVSEALLEEVIF